MRILKFLFMIKQKIKKKLVFIGDTNSINIELISKSFHYLKNKVNYIIICDKKDLLKYLSLLKFDYSVNEIFDPINFTDYKKNYLNIFNVENKYKKKYLNLLNQIKICNNLANATKFDLITMPINKTIIMREIKFIGMTEYLGFLNKKATAMLMYGDKFSIIPITTHINLKKVHKYLKPKYINTFVKNILKNLTKTNNGKLFDEIKFLCYNPHCGEDGFLGLEDIIIKESIKKFTLIKGPYSADSSFNNVNKNTLFISAYHDQALIPFKIINKKSLNMTIGLNYRRLSPAHGTAKNIKFKNIADNTSYITCLLF